MSPFQEVLWLHWRQRVVQQYINKEIFTCLSVSIILFNPCTWKNSCRFSLKVTIVVVQIWLSWNVSTDFSKTPQYQISWKSLLLFMSCYTWGNRQLTWWSW
jgi:hypothetical protein